MRLCVLAASIVLYALFANGCSKGITRATAVAVLAVNGNVVFGSAEQNHFQPVTLKSKIHDGDTVRLSEGASVNLVFIPAVVAQLSGNSEIKIDELKITKDGNETSGGMRDRKARIRLNRGRLIVLFRQTDRSETRFMVNAGRVTINPDSDCLFSIWTDGTKTRVTCAEERIKAFRDARSPVTIAAGYFQEWPTTRTQPMAAADDANAQIDITDSLENGFRLEDEAIGSQNRRPF